MALLLINSYFFFGSNIFPKIKPRVLLAVKVIAKEGRRVKPAVRIVKAIFRGIAAINLFNYILPYFHLNNSKKR